MRSRITQQNHQDQRDPEVTPGPCQIPPPLTLDTQNKITWDVPQHQGPTGGESVITSCKIFSPPLCKAEGRRIVIGHGARFY